jgi:hypothetical protein
MLRLTSFVLIAVFWSGAASAQRPAPAPDTLVAADYDAFTFVPRPAEAAARRSAATARFEFDLAGFPPEAEEAFRFAASIWGTHLVSDVPIRVRADFTELDERTLGAAGPACVERSSPGVDLPRDATWYPVALAEALLGRELNPPGSPVCPGVDLVATFNSALDIDGDGTTDWYFGTDGNPPAGTYDFTTVVLHELGHGLGFVGSFAVVTPDDEEAGCPAPLEPVPVGAGCWGIGADPILPLIFDRFAEDGTGTPLLDEAVYPNPSRLLGDVLQSETVFFDGPTAVTANGTLPIDLYAPSNFEPGSSFSHLDEEVSPPGDPNSLMTPQLARAEAIFSPGPFTCAVMSDIGWPLGADCRALLQGGLVGFVGRFAEGEVVLVFRLGIGSMFTSAQLEQEQADGSFAPIPAAVGPLNPEAAASYTVRLDGFAPGRYRFRLRLFREDGESILSQPVAVGVLPDRPLAVFPNPFRGEARVVVDLTRRAEDEAERVRVVVYDVLGRRVAELFDGTPASADAVLELTLDGRGLAPGAYFVRVDGNSFEATQLVTRVR